MCLPYPERSELKSKSSEITSVRSWMTDIIRRTMGSSSPRICFLLLRMEIGRGGLRHCLNAMSLFPCFLVPSTSRSANSENPSNVFHPRQLIHLIQKETIRMLTQTPFAVSQWRFLKSSKCFIAQPTKAQAVPPHTISSIRRLQVSQPVANFNVKHTYTSTEFSDLHLNSNKNVCWSKICFVGGCGFKVKCSHIFIL